MTAQVEIPDINISGLAVRCESKQWANFEQFRKIMIYPDFKYLTFRGNQNRDKLSLFTPEKNHIRKHKSKTYRLMERSGRINIFLTLEGGSNENN